MTRKVTLICHFCKKTFQVDYWFSNQKYCSRECARSASRGKTMVEMRCKFCGKKFIREKCYQGQKYCSYRCSVEAKKKNIIKTCEICGKKFNVKPSIAHKRFTCSKACDKERRSIMYSGAGAPTFKNRQHYYKNTAGQRLRRLIRERDNYTCQECGKTKTEMGRNPIVHHIDGNYNNNLPDNLICLCHSCHTKIHWQMRREEENGSK